MFAQMFTTPDLPDQLYAELVETRNQERLARHTARDRKSARVATTSSAGKRSTIRLTWLRRPQPTAVQES